MRRDRHWQNGEDQGRIILNGCVCGISSLLSPEAGSRVEGMHDMARPLLLAVMNPTRALRAYRFHFEHRIPAKRQQLRRWECNVALELRGSMGKGAANFTPMGFHYPAYRAHFVSHIRPSIVTLEGKNIGHATYDQGGTAESTIKLAVLIDADNAQPSMSGLLLAEVAKYGTACVKRAYGDWTGTSLTGWKGQLLKQAIQPIQQFTYTHGKNATDTAMIIDAMDLLYSHRFDGFCLVSSDSDFTRLAVRIRESGLPVYGFGNRTTPGPFVAACNRFVYIENLAINEEHGIQADEVVSTQKKRAAAAVKDARLMHLLEDAIEAASEEDGWAPLADVGSLITKRHPDFDPRSYGYRKLSGLIAATSIFEVTRRSRGEGKSEIVYVRSKCRAHEHSSQ